MTVILYHKNDVIGLYESYELCNDFIKSLSSIGFDSRFKIVKFKINTCIKEWTKEISTNINNIEEDKTSETFIKKENNYVESKKDQKTETKKTKKKNKKEAKDKQKEQYNINLLKAQREKIIESKNKYEVDLKLYNNFKDKLRVDPNFEIPEIFTEKYSIFKRLDDNNDLNWDSFATEYKEKDFNGRFSNIFEVSNEFDQKFCSNTINIESSESSESDSESDSDIEESSEYNDDSGTEDEILEVFSSEETNE